MASLPLPVIGLQHLMRQTFEHQAIDLPYNEEIYLRRLLVAGLAFHEAGLAAVELTADAELILKREPDNAHDRYAVAVLSQKGQMLGYLPRRENRILARLMDAGKNLIARVDYVHIQEEASRFDSELKIRIYLSSL